MTEICLSCYQYATACQCEAVEKQRVEIDDNFADLILELNQLFHTLQLNLRTKFCCAGHLTPREIAPDFMSALDAYILFEGDFYQFVYFMSGLEKVQNEPLFRNNPDLTIGIEIFETNDYRLSVTLEKDNPELSDKILFLQGKARLMKFLSDRITEKWKEIDLDYD